MARVIDFVYELVVDKYSQQTGRPSIGPVVPCTRPKTKEGYFTKQKYRYDLQKDFCTRCRLPPSLSVFPQKQ